MFDIQSVRSVSITDSKFSNMDSASNVGYAIRGSSVGTLKISKTTFQNIQNRKDSVIEFRKVESLILDNVKVTNCTGEIRGVLFGEIVSLEASKLNCYYCQTQKGNGGSIYYTPYSSDNLETKLSIQDSVFESSKAKLGGGVYINSKSQADSVELSIENTQFLSSEASRGAALYIAETVSFTSGVLNGVTITNAHTSIGAPINDYHSLGKLEIRNSTISGSSGYYCAFYGDYTIQGELLSITNSEFYSGSCDKQLVHLKSWVPGVSAVLDSCSASNFNSGIRLENIELTARNLKVKSFSGSSALIEQNSNFTVYNTELLKYDQSAFEQVQSQLGQSEFYESYSNTVTTPIVVGDSSAAIYTSKFKNQIGGLGSTIKMESSNVTIDNCAFENSVGLEEGGVAYLMKSSLRVYNTQFKELSSPRGGVFSGIMSSHISVYNSTYNQVSSSTSGGVFFMSSGSIQMFDSQILNSTSPIGGALYITDPSRVKIQNCSFSESSAENFGGAIFIANSKESSTVPQIENCIFSNNSANKGGAVYTRDSVLNITDSYFEHNSAVEGGGVFIESSNYNYNSSSISNCSFANNSAATNGGCIIWKSLKPQLEFNYYSNNSALYGAQVASYAISMKSLSRRRLSEGPVVEYLKGVPGQKVEPPLQIALIDHYNNVVATDNSSKANLKGSNTTISGKTEVQAQNGVFVFDDFEILDSPNQNLTLEVYARSIEDTLSNSKDTTNLNPTVSVEVKLRDCQQGEYNAGNECQLCPEGKYSLSPDQPCTACPAQAYCLGNWTMFPRPGYWRPFKDNGAFYKCPNSEACLGSPDYSNYLGNCSEGYRGKMCQACQKGYFRTFENTCTACPDPTLNILRLIGMIVFMAAYNVFLVKTTLDSAYEPEAVSSIYMKIFTNYTQLTYLTTQFKLKWPKLVVELFSLQKATASLPEQLFSVDCYLQNSGDSFEDAVFIGAAVMSLLPILLSMAAAVVWGVISLKKRSCEPMKKELIATLIIVFFTVHPTIINSLFSLFSCTEIEGLGVWLVQDLEVECWDGTHTFYAMAVALPGIIVWGIATPAFIIRVMYKRKNYLSRIENKLRFGFVFNGYKVDKFYWEFVIMYREVAIICLAVFLSGVSVMIQSLMCFLMLMLFCYFHTREKPFIESHLNGMETRSVVTATITIYCGLYYFSEDLEEVSEFLLFLLICASNASFLTYWTWHFLKDKFVNFISKFPRFKMMFFKSDGFDGDMYVDNSYRKGKITVDGCTRYTLIKHKEPEEDPLPGIYTMLDLYREAFKHIDEGPEDSEEENHPEEEKQPEEESRYVETLQVTDLSGIVETQGEVSTFEA